MLISFFFFQKSIIFEKVIIILCVLLAVDENQWNLELLPSAIVW